MASAGNMFTVSLVGDRELTAKLVSMPDNVRLSLQRKVTQLTLMLEEKVKTEHLSGPTGAHTLSVVTGRLRRSVFSTVDSTSTHVKGIVGFSADVSYAAIHEFGGVISLPDIVPVKAQVLYWVSGSNDVFSKFAAAHDIHMPERAPLGTSLQEMASLIKAQLREAVVQALVSSKE